MFDQWSEETEDQTSEKTGEEPTKKRCKLGYSLLPHLLLREADAYFIYGAVNTGWGFCASNIFAILYY